MSTTYKELSDILQAESGRIAPSKESDQTIKYNDAYKDFSLTLTEYFNQFLSKGDIQLYSISQQSKVHLAFLSKSKHESYRLNPESTVTLCYEYFHISVQQFLMGQLDDSTKLPAVELPANLNVVANYMANLELGQKEKITQMTKKMWLANRLAADYAPSAIDIFRERYAEICSDVYTNYIGPIGSDCPDKLRRFVKRMYTRTDNQEVRVPLPVAIGISILAEQPIDYFITMNYAQYLPISYRPNATAHDMNTKAVIITDPNIKSVIEYLITATSDERSRMIGCILSQSI